jgi:DNA modification methylase
MAPKAGSCMDSHDEATGEKARRNAGAREERVKPYYQDEASGITIYHGDCRDILPMLPKVDLVLTDPPYGMKKADWDELIPAGEWLPIARTLGRVAVFTGVRGLFDYPKPDWTLSWVRLASTQRNGVFGGFNNWEPILFYSGGHISNDTFSVPNIPDGGTGDHPTPKPLRLLLNLIARLDPQVVLDPFLGSGTTLVACKRLGRRGIGIEIEEKYCEIAAKRLEMERLELFEPPPEQWILDMQEPNGDEGRLSFQPPRNSLILERETGIEPATNSLEG